MENDRYNLEAFRYGLVPIKSIKEWTFGRETEITQIEDWLADEGSATLVIEGAYGSGKTHLLNYLMHHGALSNYAISYVTLNPLEAPPSFPKRVYRNIVKNFKYSSNGKAHDFKDFIYQVADSSLIKEHAILGPVAQRLTSKKDDKIWDYILAKDVNKNWIDMALPPLPDHTTAANVYCYILSGISALAQEVLGAKGFLILFDEMELASTYTYQYEWLRGLNFLDGLSKTAFDEEGLSHEDLFRQNNVTRGTTTGLIYSGFNQAPYSFREPSYLKLVVAITPEFIENFGGFMFNKKVRLTNLPEASLKQFLTKIMKTYKDMYGIWLSGSERLWIYENALQEGQLSIRRAIKLFIECLDCKRHYPKCSITELNKQIF